MAKTFSEQISPGTVVQMHGNGEPLCYPNLGEALLMFKHCIRQFNTNGKLLLERSDEIIGNLETLTISVIENDAEGDDQYEIVSRFLSYKGNRKPFFVYRLLGNVEDSDRWQALPGIVAKRILHSPGGSFDYQKDPTIPEIGICLDLLTHLAIDRFGNISLCVRFDPEGDLRIGNIKETTLAEAMGSEKRRFYLANHIEGRRSELPGCARCEYWGIPRGE